MNMSDDVTGVTLQITEKAASAAARSVTSIIDLIGKLLRDLMAMQQQRERNRSSVHGTDLTNIKAGRVERQALQISARGMGDTMTVSENGLTKEDVKFISKKAKEYGIPVAFSNEKSKDNIFASVRTSDLPLFKQVCTECMKQKIAERPQELGNFHCEAWEIPFLTAHLNHNDLSAGFVQTADGKNRCIFDKKDEKAVRLTRDEFVKQCVETKKDLNFDRDEAGFFTIKNIHTGKEISFDQLPDKVTLSSEIQKTFGYTEEKANLAAARFGDEMLQGAEREHYFSNDVQSQFKQIAANVTVDGENKLCKEYQCWRVTPKADERPRIVFSNVNGEFAVLEPEKMTRKQMRTALSEQLGVADRRRQTALIEKAENVAFFYAQQEARTAGYAFTKDDFDTTERLPLSDMNSEINRADRDSFRVNSTVTAIEKDAAGIDHAQHDKKELVLTFADKRSALKELQAMYESQGVPAHVAKQMSKEVYQKAETQNPERVLHIQEVRNDAMTVAFGTVTKEITTADKQAAASKIAAEFGVPSDTAEVIVEKAQEIKVDTVQQRVDSVQEKQTDLGSLTPQDGMVICSAADPQKHFVVDGDGDHRDSLDDDTVLTFESEKEYQDYMNDREFLAKAESDDANSGAESRELSTESVIGSNGHELHPEGNALAEAAPSVGKVEVPTAPELPPPSMGARR